MKLSLWLKLLTRHRSKNSILWILSVENSRVALSWITRNFQPVRSFSLSILNYWKKVHFTRKYDEYIFWNIKFLIQYIILNIRSTIGCFQFLVDSRDMVVITGKLEYVCEILYSREIRHFDEKLYFENHSIW